MKPMIGSADHLSAPLIGITASVAGRDDGTEAAVFSPLAYAQAVERAGGVPVVLPPVPPRSVPQLIAGLAGLLITCGPVPPGPAAARGRPADAPHRARHAFELTLVRAAIGAGRPFLAVCGGLHALNAAQAGTQACGTPLHGPARTPAHNVQVSASSRLGRILGIRASVPAGHPHRLQRLGIGLLAVAWPDDQVIETVDTIEAVEVARHPFGIGVQWHAEEEPDLRLIRALVAVAAAPPAAPGQARAVPPGTGTVSTFAPGTVPGGTVPGGTVPGGRGADDTVPAGPVPAGRQAHYPVW